jgi:hypothetical protein
LDSGDWAAHDAQAKGNIDEYGMFTIKGYDPIYHECFDTNFKVLRINELSRKFFSPYSGQLGYGPITEEN